MPAELARPLAPATQGGRPNQPRIIWECDSPHEPACQLRRDAPERVPRLANVLKARGIKKGRRRHHLHADDPRGDLKKKKNRDARLCPDRRDPFGGLRRLFAGQPEGPDQRRGGGGGASTCVITADEGLRGGRKVPLKEERPTAAREELPRRAQRRRGPAHRRSGRMDRRPRPLVRGGVRQGLLSTARRRR